ncbi:major capsid protein [Novosphingobium sp. RL4]|uniref:major capsid protein n=1 Tax=Novosphingobium sp. RL4 TaxID=3109595 RepID=UPI002D797E13|nr:major capsid protein [Novosphingobium sp. RL4]WRT95905.1 major capsid protein [Novosphingobium sp. RL4]
MHALVGDAFYDALINHPQVRETYLNWSAAADLRGNISFGDFEYGGITWHNYQGTDDNSTVAVGVDNAIFFPVGAQDVFKKSMAPA